MCRDANGHMLQLTLCGGSDSMYVKLCVRVCVHDMCWTSSTCMAPPLAACSQVSCWCLLRGSLFGAVVNQNCHSPKQLSKKPFVSRVFLAKGLHSPGCDSHLSLPMS